MYFPPLESDQLYTWSDKNAEKRACCYLEKAPPSPRAPATPTQDDSARLADRALQTLWQAGVQVRRRSRPWTQVLPFGELPGIATANGLCAARVSRSDRRVRRQLPPNPRDLRSDLRDQSRTAAPPRGALHRRYDPSALCPSCGNRCRLGRCASRQLGRSLPARQPRLFAKHGGSR